MKEWINNLLSKDGSLSSKRFMGLLIGFNFMVYCYTNPGNLEVIKVQALTMGGLLGVSAAIDIFKKKEEKLKKEEDEDEK